MADFSKSDFAAYCGVRPSAVSYALSKGKLKATVADKKTVIDSDLEDNQAQMRVWLDKKALKESADVDKTPETTTPDSSPPVPKQLNESQLLDLQQKKLNVEIKQTDLDKARLQKKRLLGETVPTPLVSNLFVSLGSSFQTSYRSNTENLLNELFHRAKVDPAIASEFKGRLIGCINDAHAEAIEAVQEGLKTIIQEQKEKHNKI